MLFWGFEDKMKYTRIKNKDFKRAIKFELPIYPFGVHYCLLSEKSKSYLYGKEAKAVREGQELYIYFNEGVSIETAVHELFHLTEFVMEHIGQPLSKSPNETWAYLLGFLTEEFYKFYKHK